RPPDAEEQIGECKAGRILHPLFLRASVAEIHLLHLALQNLGQEDRRVIAFANVAQHLCQLDLESLDTFKSEYFRALSASEDALLSVPQKSVCLFHASFPEIVRLCAW